MLSGTSGEEEAMMMQMQTASLQPTSRASRISSRPALKKPEQQIFRPRVQIEAEKNRTAEQARLSLEEQRCVEEKQAREAEERRTREAEAEERQAKKSEEKRAREAEEKAVLHLETIQQSQELQLEKQYLQAEVGQAHAAVSANLPASSSSRQKRQERQLFRPRVQIEAEERRAAERRQAQLIEKERLAREAAIQAELAARKELARKEELARQRELDQQKHLARQKEIEAARQKALASVPSKRQERQVFRPRAQIEADERKAAEKRDFNLEEQRLARVKEEKDAREARSAEASSSVQQRQDAARQAFLETPMRPTSSVETRSRRNSGRVSVSQFSAPVQLSYAGVFSTKSAVPFSSAPLW